MENDKCILVEFINESNLLAAEYRTWLLNDDYRNDDDEIQKIMDNKMEVAIKWPNCDIKSAIAMRKIIQTLYVDDWTVYAVRIYGYGGMYTEKILNLK
ncbi:hypothetical protein ALC57_04340 [Trachymyrmex cornetzi]|uniref:Uncharacterized protein n=1 Tax=Trachymyrmex cornetzi TaxID=471704 RepID=A0A151JCH4_9HYME|nr:hypothetical protein ALC57_04340 [Trachymyrmex cornetzi]